jgi:hypothetical protein
MRLLRSLASRYRSVRASVTPADDVLDRIDDCSAARLPRRGPWLCVPASRPVCLCRVIVEGGGEYFDFAIGQAGAAGNCDSVRSSWGKALSGHDLRHPEGEAGAPGRARR